LELRFWTAGCLFYFLAKLNEEAGFPNWVDTYFEDKGDGKPFGHDTDVFNKYMASLYWAFVTCTTVGYGDINPATLSERNFVLLMTFVGSATSAMMINQMAILTESKCDRLTEYDRTNLAFEDLFKFYKLPKELREILRRDTQKNFDSEYFKKSDLLAHLNSDLKDEVMYHVRRTECSSYS
jgi:hypothetical protein